MVKSGEGFGSWPVDKTFDVEVVLFQFTGFTAVSIMPINDHIP